MLKFLKQWKNDEKGQALVIVLILLAVGSLTVAMNLNYATASMKGNGIVTEKLKGIYAATAGIESTLWSLLGDSEPLEQLTENINQMPVVIETVDKGTYTLYFGEMIAYEGSHIDWMTVTGNITPTEISGQYVYTVTVTRQPACVGNKKLTEVGARLPVGYSYVAGSSANASNLSIDDPTMPIATDISGAYLPTWTLPNVAISAGSPVKTQSFLITGSGSQSGEYAWVKALSSDIGTIGEVSGTLYRITGTARRPTDNQTTAEIFTDVLIRSDGTVTVLSWKITE